MNRLYDFNEIQQTQKEQKKLILNYVLLAICFIAAMALACALIKSNALFTVIFALASFAFSLFSVAFWKIKYGIFEEYKMFLDKLETGKRSDYVGVFEGKEEKCEDGDDFERYVFSALGKQMSFEVQKEQKIILTEGKKYHIECVGRYIYRWEKLE